MTVNSYAMSNDIIENIFQITDAPIRMLAIPLLQPKPRVCSEDMFGTVIIRLTPVTANPCIIAKSIQKSNMKEAMIAITEASAIVGTMAIAMVVSQGPLKIKRNPVIVRPITNIMLLI